MKTVGIIATSIAGVAALVALLLGIRSVPDAKRYLRIRQM